MAGLRHPRRAIVALSVVIPFAACRGSEPPTSPPSATAALSAAKSVAGVDAGARPEPSRSVSTDAGGAWSPTPISLDIHTPTLQLPAGTGVIACGTQLCTAPTEICCQDRRGRLSCLQSGTAEVCSARLSCDSSDDCPAGESCCDRVNDAVCQPAGPDQLCTWLELCSDASSCQDPAARCVVGHCREVANLTCGVGANGAPVRCTDEEPVCCARPSRKQFECRPFGEGHCFFGPPIDEPTFTFICRTDADCLPGQRCRARLQGGTDCMGGDWGASTPVCRSDADCSGTTSSGRSEASPQPTPACLPSRMLGIRICQPRSGGW